MTRKTMAILTIAALSLLIIGCFIIIKSHS